MAFTRAIVRPPSANFAAGLTSSEEGAPNFELAQKQHEEYCTALRRCGLRLTHLAEEPAFPDATFVEDTAIVTERGAILTRPGAPSRRGEVDSIAVALRGLYADLKRITSPNTVDGGDICEADDHFLIGVSARTNESGADELAGHLRSLGYSASLADIRAVPGLLHLKTGIAYLGEGVWLVAEDIVGTFESWRGLPVRKIVPVRGDEAYAANCVRVNEAVLLPRGYPKLAGVLREAGLTAVTLEMSEFRKMDGGLSCLSLRF